MILSKFNRSVRRVNGYIKDTERYLSSTSERPGALQLASLGYKSARIVANLVGYQVKNEKQKQAYQNVLERLETLKSRVIATGAQAVERQASDAEKAVKETEARAKQMAEVGLHARPDYETPSILLQAAQANFSSVAGLVDMERDKKSVEVLGPTAQRIVELREELESKKKK